MVPSDRQFSVPDLVLAAVRQPGSGSPVNVHIRDGLVAGISPGGGPLPVQPGEQVIDCEGRYIIPGLWDEHVHMTQWAMHTNRLDLSKAASAHEAAAAVTWRASAGLMVPGPVPLLWEWASGTRSGRTCPAGACLTRPPARTLLP